MHVSLKKFQTVAIASVFMVGSIAGYWLLSQRISIDGEALRARIQTVANEQAFENQLGVLEQTVKDTEAERTELQKFILNDENDTISLLSRFDTIAEEQQLELATNELQVIEKAGNFNDLSIGYTFTGDEETVMRMVKMFETLPYHSHITRLSFQRTSNAETGEKTATAQLSLLVSIKKKI